MKDIPVLTKIIKATQYSTKPTSEKMFVVFAKPQMILHELSNESDNG